MQNRDIMALPAPSLAVLGYPLEQAPDLTRNDVRAKLSGSAIRGFSKITGKWGLTDPQARALLGGIASSTFYGWKGAPDNQKLTQDTLLRISLVVGIYQALNMYFDAPLADRWITLPNRGPLFNGATPLDYMIRHGQPAMYQVRQMLDTWLQGR